MAENIVKNDIFDFYKILLNDLIISNGYLNLREDISEKLNKKDNYLSSHI